MVWIGTSDNDIYYDNAGINDMNGGEGDDRLYGLDGNDIFRVTSSITGFPDLTISTAAAATIR